ncbi:MAG: hypothetical protein K1000chlam2_01563 [Chlamydiae bacterium]|nr:hypothetical protein [Chlamydiota bacterium]
MAMAQLSNSGTMTPQDDFISIKEFCEKYPTIKEGSLRWILFNSKFNGADSFVRRLGKRRLVISPTLFFTWLEESRREVEQNG